MSKIFFRRFLYFDFCYKGTKNPISFWDNFDLTEGQARCEVPCLSAFRACRSLPPRGQISYSVSTTVLG